MVRCLCLSILTSGEIPPTKSRLVGSVKLPPWWFPRVDPLDDDLLLVLLFLLMINYKIGLKLPNLKKHDDK